MDEYFVDKWGELHKVVPKSQWIDFEPWERWKDEFDWIECGNNIDEQDIIVWRDTVITEQRNGSKNYQDGARLVIGRVCNIEDQRLYIEVIASDGLSPLDKEEKISRLAHWLTQYGVYRFPRAGESLYSKDSLPINDIHPKQLMFIDNSLEMTQYILKSGLRQSEHNKKSHRINKKQ